MKSTIATLLFFSLFLITMPGYAAKHATPSPNAIYLSDKMFTDEELTDWLKQTLPVVFTVNKATLDSVKKENHALFTSAGYSSWFDLMDQYALFSQISDKDFALTLYLDDPFKIQKQGVVNHLYQWQITTTLSLLLKNQNQAYTLTIPVFISVLRSPPNTGIGVLLDRIDERNA